MPAINTLNDTPVRHDDNSITKTSLLYRPQKKGAVEKVNRICDEEISDEKKYFVSISSKTVNSSPLEIQSVDADSKTDNDVSVITVDEMETTTSALYNGPLSHKCISEEKVLISMKKLTTPEYIEPQTKAVSSTPNQEILNTSRLKRNVASQTTLTLNARELIEYDKDIKSCIIEIPEERSVSVPGISQMSHSNMDITSPSRSLCTSKLTNYNTPVDHKITNVRKLSLRSKTMITSAIERSKDMFPRYKSLEEKRIISNTFSLLPRPNTPPMCSEQVIHNPFEVDLSERLGKSIFSPNVFENVLSPSEDSESIKWTIEDIPSINPVPIEEDFTLPSDDEDPEKENQVQQEIERYFSETHSVLSPDELSQQRSGQNKNLKHYMRAAASTPQKASLMKSKEFTCANTQTALSLPQVLSKELECSLTNIFKLFETNEFNISASNLRRKLFFHSEDEAPSPVRFEIHSSPVARDSWDLDHSPYTGHRRGRHFTPLANQGAFSSPEISPVVHESANVKLSNNLLSTCKKTLDYYFSGNQLQTEGENDDLFEGALENSTVIMHSINVLGEMVVDTESSSAMPFSQDTGYHTEESWQHCRPFSMMASTPTRRGD